MAKVQIHIETDRYVENVYFDMDEDNVEELLKYIDENPWVVEHKARDKTPIN